MSEHKVGGRTAWFDETTQAPLIGEYAQRLAPFLAAVADGQIDHEELAGQEARVVKLMKQLEPKLDAALHEQVTELLCELTAYDIMHTMHIMEAARRQQSVFRG